MKKQRRQEINFAYRQKQLEAKFPDLTKDEAIFVIQALYTMGFVNWQKLEQAVKIAKRLGQLAREQTT